MGKNKNDVVVLNLDRPRIVRFGHKALKMMDSLTGLSMDKLGDFESFEVEQVEKIMYCGLLSDAKANNETLKLEDMEDILDQAEQWSDILKAMTQALQYSFGGFDEKNAQGIVEKK